MPSLKKQLFIVDKLSDDVMDSLRYSEPGQAIQVPKIRELDIVIPRFYKNIRQDMKEQIFAPTPFVPKDKTLKLSKMDDWDKEYKVEIL